MARCVFGDACFPSKGATVNASRSFSVNGEIKSDIRSRSVLEESQSSSNSFGMMNGMRGPLALGLLWILAIKAFASAVTMLTVLIDAPVSGSFQLLEIPAKAIGASSLNRMWCGNVRFAKWKNSKNPSTSIKHRCCTAMRNAGFSKMVSPRAFNVCLLTIAACAWSVSYTHLRAHETVLDLVCRLLLEKKKNNIYYYRRTYFISLQLSN